MTYLNYIDAVEMARRGHLIARKDWDKSNGVIFFRPDDTLNKAIIPGIKSIPQKLKDYMAEEAHYMDYFFTGYLARYVGGIIANAWQPTEEEENATDWYVVK